MDVPHGTATKPAAYSRAWVNDIVQSDVNGMETDAEFREAAEFYMNRERFATFAQRAFLDALAARRPQLAAELSVVRPTERVNPVSAESEPADSDVGC